MASSIGITPDNNKIISDLTEDKTYFDSEQDVARFAFAYAIKMRLDIIDSNYYPSNTTTKWHYEAIDPKREMYDLISVLHPEVENKEKYVEKIINQGISAIGKKMSNGHLYSITPLINEMFSLND